MPAFAPDCTYRSPQALGIFLMVHFVGRLLRPVFKLALKLFHGRGVWFSALYEAIHGVVCSDWGSFRGWAGRERVNMTFAQNTLDENILNVATRSSWIMGSSRKLTLDVIERCLDDSVRLYVLEDLKPIVKELLLRIQYPLSPAVSERCGRIVAGVVALDGDFLDLAMDALRTWGCLADECYLDVSVREVVDALETSVSEGPLERRATMTCTFSDVVASIALHPHMSRGQHRDLKITSIVRSSR
ncbi:hypothetical protein C8T65DRAFT_742989 [Cerioporus squamosus]|nr:hypothetical protein C8T65DRAFT_742989 [Cerioporus squamosus]